MVVLENRFEVQEIRVGKKVRENLDSLVQLTWTNEILYSMHEVQLHNSTRTNISKAMERCE